MNWNRAEGIHLKRQNDQPKIRLAYSNINHSWGELIDRGPYGSKLNNMAEANQASLRLYRQCCRFMPTLCNKTTINYAMDYHMSKRILGMWFRRGKNMRNKQEITVMHAYTQDYLYEAVQGNVENSDYAQYIHRPPATRDGSQNVIKTIGLDLSHQRKFVNKTRFLQKFIKGTRSLMK